MTTKQQAAFLARLRDKGLGLAPHVEGGRVVRSKGKSKHPTQRAAQTGRTAPQGPGKAITPPSTPERATGHTAPGEFTLWIPAPAPFLNANDRLNRWDEAKRVKAWRIAAWSAAHRHDVPQGIGRLQIDAYVIKPRANRYDPANYQDTAKAATDGLIDYGLAEDDNRKIVTGPFMHDGGKGPNTLRIVVTVLDTL